MPGSRTSAAAVAHQHYELKESPDGLSERTAPDVVIRVLLKESELTQSELASMVGVDERSIRRWATGDGPVVVQTRHARAIDDLRYLHVILSPSLPGVEFGRWLHARNRLLGGERPMEMIINGRYDDVKDAAQAFADGTLN